MNKKKVFTLALAVCLIAILSMSTLAWFTDSDKVDNEFLIAGSEDSDPDKVFSVDVWENRDTNGDGDYNEENDAEKDTDGLVYENILPGDALSKEVHVENTGSYDQYIRVTVEISDAFAWYAALNKYDAYNDATLLAIFGGFDQSKWSNITTESLIDADNDLNVIRVVMYYNDIVKVGENITVFDTVNIPTTLTREEALYFNWDGVPGFTVNVTADAVQTENVGVDPDNDVCDAYEAFSYVAAH